MRLIARDILVPRFTGLLLPYLFVHGGEEAGESDRLIFAPRSRAKRLEVVILYVEIRRAAASAYGLAERK